MRKLLSFLVLVALMPVVFLLYRCNPSQEEIKLVILHTNDMHAHLKNFGKLAAVIEKTRKENKNVMVVCAGDIFSGDPVVDQYPEKGYPQIDLMNRTGFQLCEIGNHEFDYGQAMLEKRIAEANFPFICANMQVIDSPIKQPAPDFVWNVEGLKIVFIGLLQTSAENLPSTNPVNVKGLKFSNGVDVAGNYSNLKSENDAVIGLTHLGVETDRQLAEKYPYFDVIVGGHSHTLIKDPKETNHVLITQAGDYLHYVGMLTLTFKGHQLIHKQDKLIGLDDYPETDSLIDSLVESYNNNPAYNRVIGEATEPVEGKNELGAMFTDAVLACGNFDFAFQNNGGIRIDRIDRGPVTVKTIYELDPFGNEVVSLDMTYDELKSLMKYSFEHHHNSPDLQVSGGQYEIITNPDHSYKDVSIKDIKGKELIPGKIYRVALSNYIISAYHFNHKDPGKSMGITTAESIINFIEAQKTIDYHGVKRIFIK